MLRFFRILTILTIFALALPLQLIAKEQFTIIIDPGHGGGDYGTPHRKCKQDEKTIALNVALKLGKLIEKKRNIKTGAMQELLGMRNAECGMRNVPRRRLSGFSGEWVEKRLGDCGLCFNGITGKAGSDFGHGEAHYITFLNVLSNVVIDTEILDAVDIKRGENKNEVRRGDLFFNTSSETAEEVGFCAVLDEEVTSVYLNSFCFGFRLTDDNVSGKFLAYWFRATGGRALMTFLAQGSTRYNLSKDAFREACISIPPTLAEQRHKVHERRKERTGGFIQLMYGKRDALVKSFKCCVEPVGTGCQFHDGIPAFLKVFFILP